MRGHHNSQLNAEWVEVRILYYPNTIVIRSGHAWISWRSIIIIVHPFHFFLMFMIENIMLNVSLFEALCTTEVVFFSTPLIAKYWTSSISMTKCLPIMHLYPFLRFRRLSSTCNYLCVWPLAVVNKLILVLMKTEMTSLYTHLRIGSI